MNKQQHLLMRIAILSTILVCLILVGCGSDSPPEYSYRPPESMDDGFDVGSLEEVGIDFPSIGEESTEYAKANMAKCIPCSFSKMAS